MVNVWQVSDLDVSPVDGVSCLRFDHEIMLFLYAFCVLTLCNLCAFHKT